MTDALVKTEIVRHARGPWARITIDNAAKANSLATPVIEQLRDAFRALRDDAHLRLAVLTGAGERSFIAGANLHELKDLDPPKARAYLSLLSEANTAIRNLPVPVIARINGVCIGAGLEIAAACDLRIAAAHARLGMPEVALDLPSVVEAALFPRLMGWGRTAWLLYRGDPIDAATAERWGLVEKASSQGALDADVGELVERILANGPVGIRQQKALMRDWERMSLQDGIAAGIDSIAKAYRIGEPGRYVRDTIGGLKK